MSRSQPQGYCRMKGKASGAKAESVMFVAQNAIIFFNNMWAIQGEALWCGVAGFRYLWFRKVESIPHWCEDVSRLGARPIAGFWSLDTPCICKEDRCGLDTKASVLGQDAGSSRKILGGYVIPPGSRIMSRALMASGVWVRVANFVKGVQILGTWCC
jgi:hypothetical protein